MFEGWGVRKRTPRIDSVYTEAGKPCSGSKQKMVQLIARASRNFQGLQKWGMLFLRSDLFVGSLLNVDDGTWYLCSAISINRCPRLSQRLPALSLLAISRRCCV